MTLFELEPRLFVAPWPGMPAQFTVEDIARTRRGMGLHFRCPCGCGQRVHVAFTNPIDGGPPASDFPMAVISYPDGCEDWNQVTLARFETTHGIWQVDDGVVRAITS